MSTDPTQPLRPQPANAAETTDPNATTAKTPIFDPQSPSFSPAPTAKYAASSPPAPVPPPPQAPPAAPFPRQAEEPGWPEQPPRQGYGAQGVNAPSSPAQRYDSPVGYSPQGAGYGIQGAPGYGPVSQAQRDDRRRSKRRRRRWMMALFSVVVLLILLVIGDRVAVAVAESQIAGQIKSADSSINPSVNIKGFPFLTQVIAHNLKEIDISAKDIPAGPVSISSVSASAKGVHINSSFNGGTVDSINGTAFVSFSSVSSALTAQAGSIGDLQLSAAGPDKVKASFTILGTTALTATGKVTIKNNQVSVVWDKATGASGNSGGLGDIISSVLGDNGGSNGPTLPDLNFTIPKLPAGLKVTGFSVTEQGLSVTVAAQNTTLSQ
jgi:hypothetical protein